MKFSNEKIIREVTVYTRIVSYKEEFNLKVDDLLKFMNFYVSQYSNFYSKRFRHLDINFNKTENLQIYETIRDEIIKSQQRPNIVYEIIDIEKRFIRVGRSAASPSDRMKYYLNYAFSTSFDKEESNLYNAMFKCGSKANALKRFKIVVRYVFPSKGEAQIMEEFLTIFRNRANNALGYDLKINNQYNKIVGDLFRKDFLSESLNALWKDVPPDILAKYVLDGNDMQTLVSKFGASAKTIKRRFRACGYGLNGKYDLTDARAFFLKPIIIEGFKKGFTQEEFFNYCKDLGIKIFDQYAFMPNASNPRGDFFRRTIEYIWGTSSHKEARYEVLANYILSIIDRCDIRPGEAEQQLKKFITFKYDREFDRICRDVFKKTFIEKQDAIFMPLVKKLLIKNKDEHNIFIKIAIGLNLCKEFSPSENKERSSAWVKDYVERNFSTRAREELISKLTSEPFKYESLKDKVFSYMEDHPLDKPQQLIELVFQGENLETIRVYVKEWKANNRDEIFESITSIASQFIVKMNLDSKIEDKTIELLEKFISIKNLDLNVEFKGVIAGGIYLACQILGKSISQNILSSNIKVDDHTISKWYRDIEQTIT